MWSQTLEPDDVLLSKKSDKVFLASHFICHLTHLKKIIKGIFIIGVRYKRL